MKNSAMTPENARSKLTVLTLWLPILAMTIVIVASNVAVMVPINDWLTWGAFTYPFVFLVTDLTNRAVGPQGARKVAWVGLVFAVVLSVYFASWQIALASGTAFISAQLLDISLFNRLRAMSWWKAPLIGSIAASVVDTGIFFFIAFYGSDMNWLMLASGDLMVKWAMAAALLLPYRLLLPRVAAIAQRTATPAV
jgi:uncharacterized PurR-regulated membrane protein YhhQ (DUF165 family)